jgi:hypothetical protein
MRDMKRLLDILNLPLTNLIKEEYKNIKDSKHSPVYRKSGVEGFAPLFSFFSVNLGKGGYKMKTSLQLIALLFGMIIIPLQANAQAEVKAIIDFADIDEDNAVIGFSTQCTTHVLFKTSNDLDTTVYGNLYYWYKTDSMNAVNSNWYEFIDENPTFETINAGGEFDFFPFPCVQGQMRTGPVNVIIIWPAMIGPSVNVTDSAFWMLSNVHVGDLSGLVDQNNSFGSTVYPNPSSGYELIHISSKYTQLIDRISITNNLGQPVFNKYFVSSDQGSGYNLPTDFLSSGIYNIVINYIDNKTEVVRFIKN